MSNIGAFALRLGAVVVTCALLLTACGGGGGDQGSGGPFTLGYTGTLSGSFASYAQQMQQGVNLAVEELNRQGGIGGQKIEVEFADDEGQPENGPVIARQFC